MTDCLLFRFCTLVLSKIDRTTYRVIHIMQDTYYLKNDKQRYLVHLFFL